MSLGLGAVVEVVLLSAHECGLRFRVRRTDQGSRVPDAVAADLADLATLGWADPALLHSTSWRYERGRIVLTYVALPDLADAATTAPVPRRAPVSLDPLRPSSVTVEPADVAAHACRHLAFLGRTDEVVLGLADRFDSLWRLVDEFAPDVAGHLRPALPTPTPVLR